LRRMVLVLLATMMLPAESLPAWWTSMPRLQRMECHFVQQSESAVFGNFERQGTLQLARGGRMRVSYSSGLLLVCDGSALVQYDPATRTAQRFELRSAASDMPLLNVLLDLKALKESYQVIPGGTDSIKLVPRRKGLPPVELQGQGAFLHRVAWSDSTGAKQVLVLKNPHVPSVPFPASTFSFKPPEGTRWTGGK